MRLFLILGSTAVVCLLLWLFGTRPLSLLLDRVFPHRLSSTPVRELVFDSGTIALAGVHLDTLTTETLPSGVEASLSSPGRVALLYHGAAFPCGPGRSSPDPSGLDTLRFQPDPGDTVTLTLKRSLLSWPTPFEMNFMTGYSPSWRRHLYVRLLWTKRSGARLAIQWRFPQAFYPRDGWRPASVEYGSAGLLDVSLREAPGLRAAAADYLASKRQWSVSEYRLEDRGPAVDGSGELFAAIHREDEKGSQPGAGRSLELVLDYASREVVRERGLQ